MYFKQMLNERCGCASYLIASRQSNEAAIVDPAIETEQYEALLHERGFTLRYVIDTHVHADHRSGGPQLGALRGHPLTLCSPTCFGGGDPGLRRGGHSPSLSLHRGPTT